MWLQLWQVYGQLVAVKRLTEGASDWDTRQVLAAPRLLLLAVARFHESGAVASCFVTTF
jgi:hypothetical protein